MPFLESPNRPPLYYEIAGDGHPLVFVHAGIADSRMWDGQFNALSDQYKVIRYDLRGFGKSAPVAGTVVHYEDLHALLSHLGIESAYLVGCSIGATTVFDFAVAYPHMVDALIAVNGVPNGYQWPEDWYIPPQWDDYAAAVKAGDLERASELEVQIWIDGAHRGPDDVDAAIRDKVRDMNLIALQNQAAVESETSYLEPPAAQGLDRLQCPILFIGSDLDEPDTYNAVRDMAQQIAGARLIVMENTTHLPGMERPQEFNRHIREFLAIV